MAKICIVCAYGGHLTEMLYLLDAFEGHEVFYITNKGVRPGISGKKYLFTADREVYFTAVVQTLLHVPRLFKILLREKPDIIVSTGSEIAIPVFYMAKLLHIRTIFIETWTRVHNPTMTGRLVYPVADVFLVQWKETLEKYGKKAKYVGGII